MVFNRLIEWLESHNAHSVHACMESTGRYGEYLTEYLQKHGHKVSIVNPACIKAFSQSLLKRVKNDKVDALLIAKFCKINQPEEWIPPSDTLEELTELTRRVAHLEKLKTAENNHLKSGIRSKAAIQSAEELIKSIDDEIEQLKNRISELIDSEEELKKKKELLKTIPGMGDRTSEILLSETKGMNGFQNARQLAAYSGITPSKRQSGSSLNSNGRISRLGNESLRTGLYFLEIVAKNHNAVIREFCDRLIERGKSGKQVICGAIRKLLHVAYGVLKSGEPFDPNYHNFAFSS